MNGGPIICILTLDIFLKPLGLFRESLGGYCNSLFVKLSMHYPTVYTVVSPASDQLLLFFCLFHFKLILDLNPQGSF